MLDIAQAAGVDDVSVDVNYTQLTFSYVTRIQLIDRRVYDYGRLTDVSGLVERFCEGRHSLAEAQAELTAIKTAPSRYPWWGIRLAAGCAGASAAVIFGGGWEAMLTAFVANLVLDYLLGALARRDWPSFFLQASAGLVAVFAAVPVHLPDPAVDSSQVVVSVIILMLAGSWLGEAEGLKVSLAGAEAKLAQMDQIAARRGQAVNLGVPTFTDAASRTTTSPPRSP
jgi:uncharacterized membrane protein YjjP (DUF1212 family)